MKGLLLSPKIVPDRIFPLLILLLGINFACSNGVGTDENQNPDTPEGNSSNLALDLSSPGQPIQLNEFSISPSNNGNQNEVTNAVENVTALDTPVTIDDSVINDFRELAQEDNRVANFLDETSLFLGADVVRVSDKSQTDTEYIVVLVYYNYTLNLALHVEILGAEIKSVEQQPEGYQPPISMVEISIAEEIIRGNPEYSTAINNIPIKGILTQAPESHRYLYIMFIDENFQTIESMVFDMTNREIVN